MLAMASSWCSAATGTAEVTPETASQTGLITDAGTQGGMSWMSWAATKNGIANNNYPQIIAPHLRVCITWCKLPGFLTDQPQSNY